MDYTALIIGAGEMGKALSRALKQNSGAKILFWDKNPKLCSGGNLEELAKEAEYIFLCVPSPAISQVARDIKRHLRRGTLVISLTKGIERRTNLFSGEILRKNLGKSKIAILGGPILAEEINKNLPTKVTIGSTIKSFKKLELIFKNTGIYLEHSTDIQGVSVAGVLKNIYAVGLGIIDGLDLGSNARGVFVSTALFEMEAIIKKMGGRGETALSLAGIGDLEATSNSSFSTNFSVGQKIARGSQSKLISEGTVSVEPLAQRLGKENLPLALLAVRKALKNPSKAESIFKDLIKDA